MSFTACKLEDLGQRLEELQARVDLLKEDTGSASLLRVTTLTRCLVGVGLRNKGPRKAKQGLKYLRKRGNNRVRDFMSLEESCDLCSVHLR